MTNSMLLERAKLFMYRNARLLDRRRFEYWFEGGSAQAVIDALRAYQNEDGGFGGAIEPDIRCPYSQPVPTEMALAVMEEIECFDPEIMEGVIRYLRSIALPEGGFPLVFRSAAQFPHAPWWKAERDDRPSINPTGNVMGLLYKQQVKTDFHEDDWFKRSTAFIWRVFEQERPQGYHDGIQWLTFLLYTPDQERAQQVWPIVEEWLNRPGVIERDPEAGGYVHKVLDWAPLRDSYAGKFVSEAELEQHLQALAGHQQEDGGWPIHWPAVSPGGELEWRGWLTVDRLKTLKSYGLL